MKPNWVREYHREKPLDWDYVITHPSVISAVLRKAIECLPSGGKISIIDGPEFSASFSKILSYNPVRDWNEFAASRGVFLEILDLREEIWVDDGNVVTKRSKNQGDPLGNTQVDLKEELSEFSGHIKSKKAISGQTQILLKPMKLIMDSIIFTEYPVRLSNVMYL
ncbi:MAG: hypothetical protein IPJ16_05860 [Bacteroidales bacterium]|nr:hypothetical protein [Bacteroidales bacterium]